jgi:hypothetical protein
MPLGDRLRPYENHQLSAPGQIILPAASARPKSASPRRRAFASKMGQLAGNHFIT